MRFWHHTIAGLLAPAPHSGTEKSALQVHRLARDPGLQCDGREIIFGYGPELTLMRSSFVVIFVSLIFPLSLLLFLRDNSTLQQRNM
jgi:hypothetical protein